MCHFMLCIFHIYLFSGVYKSQGNMEVSIHRSIIYKMWHTFFMSFLTKRGSAILCNIGFFLANDFHIILFSIFFSKNSFKISTEKHVFHFMSHLEIEMLIPSSSFLQFMVTFSVVDSLQQYWYVKRGYFQVINCL